MRTSLLLKNILGTSERFAGYILQGLRRPGRRNAKLLADSLEVPVEWILFPEDFGINLPNLIHERLTATPTATPIAERMGERHEEEAQTPEVDTHA